MRDYCLKKKFIGSIFPKSLLVFTLLFFALQTSFAQNSFIRSLEVFEKKDSLQAEFLAKNLLSEKGKETLLSGLAITVSLEFHLKFPEQKEAFLYRKEIFKVKRDVWEDQFVLTKITRNSTEEILFKTFAETENFLSNPSSSKICSASDLPRNSAMQLALRVKVDLIPTEETRKLREWIGNSVYEKNTYQEEKEKFGFSLGSLISFFFKQKPKSDNYSTKWEFSKNFTKESLRLEKD